MLDTLTFDNRFLAELPGDPDSGPRRREVRGAVWSRVAPTPVAAPRTLAVSREMAETLGFSEVDTASEAFAQVFGRGPEVQVAVELDLDKGAGRDLLQHTQTGPSSRLGSEFDTRGLDIGEELAGLSLGGKPQAWVVHLLADDFDLHAA